MLQQHQHCITLGRPSTPSNKNHPRHSGREVPLSKLVMLWSSPQNVEYTHDNIVYNSACYLALLYLKLGMSNEAQALIIDRSFINQCYNLYILSYFPHGYRQIMMSSPKHETGYIDHSILDDWKETSSASRNGHHLPLSTDNGAHILCNLVDDMNEDKRHSFNIGPSTTLTSLFKITLLTSDGFLSDH